MTRQVTIVNTSNWRGEDIYIPGYEMENGYGVVGPVTSGTLLKMGDQITINVPDAMTLKIEPKTTGTPEQVMMKLPELQDLDYEHQVIPKVTVTLERAGA